MIETFKIIRQVYDSEASPVMSMAEPKQTPTWGHPYKLYKRKTKTRCRQLFLLKEVPMCGTASQVILWRLQVLRHLKDGLTDTGGIKIYIVYNYEATLSLGHSDGDGNDISGFIKQ